MENLKRLREIREELGISQEELAKRLGLSVNSVSKYESRPSDELLEKANKLLDGLK